jgi:hypothetical protein
MPYGVRVFIDVTRLGNADTDAMPGGTTRQAWRHPLPTGTDGRR